MKKINGRNVVHRWKQICNYLGVSKQTARRWRLDKGLPIHKSDAGIYAFCDELDQWHTKPNPPRASENP